MPLNPNSLAIDHPAFRLPVSRGQGEDDGVQQDGQPEVDQNQYSHEKYKIVKCLQCEPTTQLAYVRGYVPVCVPLSACLCVCVPLSVCVCVRVYDKAAKCSSLSLSLAVSDWLDMIIM